MDYFKKINDTYGHDVGDLVLKKFVEITKLDIKNIDAVGRLGGEEFVIILPNCSKKDGINCAERIRASIEEFRLKINGINEDIRFTSSFGVTETKEDDSIETMLKRADNALYAAKKEGRNKTVAI